MAPFKFPAVRRLIQEEFGRPLNEAFAEFSEAPLAAASIAQVGDDIERLTADGAYDTWSIREALAARGAAVVVPPSKKAVASGRVTPAGRSRDIAVTRVQEVGRRQWKKAAGNHQQGRAENTFFRYKRLLGSRLRSRDPGAQAVEVRLGCNALNRMLELGAARSVAIGG